jgi:hypothetical protein
MRLKLDENLPTILVEDLVELGHDVDTAIREGWLGTRIQRFGLERRRRDACC